MAFRVTTVDTKELDTTSIYRFINTAIPVKRCNLRCHYCYIGQHCAFSDSSDESLWYSIDHMRKALSVERLGGLCMFNLCAEGETLLFKELPNVVEMLLELGHFVTVVTNATLTSPLKKVIELSMPYSERIFFKCSFHYLELKRLNLLEKFYENVKEIKNYGISFTVELTANDEVIPHIEDIKAQCMEQIGAYCHIIESRDETSPELIRLTKIPLKEHQEAWGTFGSSLFEYQQLTYGKYQSEFCYAGEWLLSLSLQKGDCAQCYKAKKFTNLFENIEDSVHFAAIGTNCNLPHCYITYHAGIPLANCYNESNDLTYTYANERDRLCTDGTYWLTENIRQAFSHRCSEYNKPYALPKKFFIDMLMRKIYKNIDPSEDELARLSKIVTANLISKGYNHIAIYGMGIIGQWLLTMLADSSVNIIYGIDRRYSEIKSDMPIYAPDAPFPSVDAIIVSVYTEFTNISPLLREKTDANIISIVELAD